MMDKKTKECIRMLRNLVSDVQGAPYPGEDIKSELYTIWYEHAQRAAVECFEFLDANFPRDKKAITKSIEKILG
ncbi:MULTISPECIES: hypothetical protein [Treponema]|uniref:hypothetical protein n=1 Tax=Treponema TaxID=157 RepID=UPI0003548631|nr:MULTISPECIES: hypothetical protein [Treponema]EPF25459.1 hypothetical protein HMPREF1221_02005 [Treponema socranskii subsp. paredis ATCC 35535]MDR9859849.1 hypothetical protein [Treponema socranskii]